MKTPPTHSRADLTTKRCYYSTCEDSVVSAYTLCGSVFDKLIWHTIGPKSFLFDTTQFSFWASGAVNYDYIVTNNIDSLLIGSRCILNGTHTFYC